MNTVSVRWVSVAAMSLAIACGGGGAEGAEEAASGAETAGGESGDYEGAIASTDVAGGQEVYAKFCDDCHPDGGEDVGPSLIDDPHSPARLRQQIREGSGRMRPFSEARLSGEDLEKLLAYLASINAVK